MKLFDYFERFGVRKSFFARELGVQDQALRKYILGLQRPPLEILYKIQEMTDNRVQIHDWLKVPDPQDNASQSKKTG